MPRQKRLRFPGYVVHITCRCHKREFLLRFKKDRRTWRYWLWQARKRYGVRVLNYIVTSNHIHLLAVAPKKNELTQAMQLVSGRTAQSYNRRKGRRGAFWEDRYKVTLVEKDEHLINCMVYIDLNMVRAGAVVHPSQWDVCGFNEIHGSGPGDRYRILCWEDLLFYFGFSSAKAFCQAHREWVGEALFDSCQQRQPVWTESRAVGSRCFLAGFRESLGATARNLEIEAEGGIWTLKEPVVSYGSQFHPERNERGMKTGHYP